jgi:hypothetical protein
MLSLQVHIPARRTRMPDETASILAELAALRTPQPAPAAPAAASTEPNQLALDGNNPVITLAGKNWPIPLLAPRQNRHVVPAVAKITRRMVALATAKIAEVDEPLREALLASCDPDIVARLGAEAAVRRRVWEITDFAKELADQGDPEFFELIESAVYWAVTRAHPSLTRTEFDDMPIGTLELIDAIGVIAQQTGMMRKVDPSVAPLAAGETSTISPTGTPSSPS